MRRIILVIVVLILASGCATLTDVYVSKSENTRGASRDWCNGVNKIELDNISLYIKPANVFRARGGMSLFGIPVIWDKIKIDEKYSQSTYLSKEGTFEEIGGDYFYVEVLMKTDLPNLSFNPREVYLKLENGEYIRANKYLKPKGTLLKPEPNWDVLLIESPYEMWQLEKNEQSADKFFTIPQGKWVGFAVRFETLTPNPGTPFSIEIKGLKSSDKTVVVPVVLFKDKKIHRSLSPIS